MAFVAYIHAQSRMKILMLFLQLVLLAATLFLARVAAPTLPLIRGLVLGTAGTPLSYVEFTEILVIFFAFHLSLYCISLVFNRELLFFSLKRTLNEILFVILGTTCCVCYVFLFTDVSFDVNFFLYAYLVNSLFYILFFLVFAYGRRSDKESHVNWLAELRIGETLKKFVFSPWAVLTGLVVLAVGVLAFYYKQSDDFRNSVNYMKVSFNVGSKSNWELVDAFPGHRFTQPMDVRFVLGNDSVFYVLERSGRLYRISTQPQWKQDLILDITEAVGGIRVENGALSFALHPEFGMEKSANRGFGYVYYTHVRPGMQRNRLSRFDLSLSNLADRVNSEVILIDQGRRPNGFHNGGTVLFGPDGFLYLSVGNLGNFQNDQTISGKLASGIIRIDVDKRGGEISRAIETQPLDGKTGEYYIPRDNPFFGAEGVLEEFWAMGFRNPFRMSFDPKTGEMWLGDVGDELYEEINKVTRGSNGQATYKEGLVFTNRQKPKKILGKILDPVYFYRQTALKRAVIGGIVYRGTKHPELYGEYIFADNQAGLIWQLNVIGVDVKPRLLAQTDQLGQNGITLLTESPEGNVLVTVMGSTQQKSGRILKLVKADPRNLASTDPGVKHEATPASVSAKYDMLCSRCHGIDGKGAVNMPFDRQPANFTLAEWQRLVSDNQIKDIIKKGGAAVGLSRDMPSWAGVFSETELDLMLQKIRSFAQSDAAPQSKTP